MNGNGSARVSPGVTAAEQSAPELAGDAGVRAAYQAHGPELYRFALRQLRDGGAAQDVVQEVFLRAWRSAGSFDPEVASLRVWLFAITRNVVVDHVRRSAARPNEVGGTTAERLSELAGVDGRFEESVVTGWVVEEALRRVSAEHREALVEVHLRGRPGVEVAVELGVPIGTVRSRVFYGLKALRLAMDEMGVQP